ncbi:MAG: exosome complex RNA-binding protein Rrp4 [Candidatus Woesearchaeota archaeon]
MGELKIEARNVVVPGDVIAEGMDFLPSTGTYRRDEEIVASRLGLVSVEGKVIKLIPLSGTYIPKAGDVIIGKVKDIAMTGWMMETNTPYTAILNVKDATSQFIARGADLTRYFNIGDYVATKIINVTSQMLVDLSTKGPGLKRLVGGQVIKAEPSKVPRIVGKSGSMVSMIKEATKCKIVVGQNGLVWLNGSPKGEVIAVNTIRMIEKESHVSGLTERVDAYLKEQTEGLDLHEVEIDRSEETFAEERDERGFSSGGPRGDRRPPRRDGPRKFSGNNSRRPPKRYPSKGKE